jgi:hypothetical protein
MSSVSISPSKPASSSYSIASFIYYYILTNAIGDHFATGLFDHRTAADYHGNQAAT